MNAKGNRTRLRLSLCPKCGMDSGRRVISETVPEKNYVICDTCGWHTKGYSDMAHATREWNSKVFL